jgi:hypothetical protein
MPVLIFIVCALFGVGFFAREELRERPAAVIRPTIAPAHSAWARACEARLQQAARDFEATARTGCRPGSVAISTLPSGVDYVEYQLTSPEGALYTVTVTEEPQNPGEPTGWRGAPGCRGSYDNFEAVRHDNGRLALIQARGPRGFHFAQSFEPVTNFCVELPQ